MSDPDQLLVAAREGRVDTLFVDPNARADEDGVVDAALVETVRHGVAASRSASSRTPERRRRCCATEPRDLQDGPDTVCRLYAAGRTPAGGQRRVPDSFQYPMKATCDRGSRSSPTRRRRILVTVAESPATQA